MTKRATTSDPTREQWEAYRKAFNYFNRELFSNELPRCMLHFSRNPRFKGYFAELRWERPDGLAHEITLNPSYLKRPPRETMSTLVHEMVHCWQVEFGKPSRRCYHNREWADKMESLGLMPSDTGQPGGKRTGQRVTHYIIAGAPFDIAFQAMPQELPWTSGTPAEAAGPAPKTKSKTKYTCPRCNANAWGKPDLHLGCRDCDNEPLVPEPGQ
jgi:hypothetical protein